MLAPFWFPPIPAAMLERQGASFTVVGETLHSDGITHAAGYGAVLALPTNHRLPGAMPLSANDANPRVWVVQHDAIDQPVSLLGAKIVDTRLMLAGTAEGRQCPGIGAGHDA